MSSQNDIICESCGKIYITVDEKWCRPCVINNLEKNFTNWTSGNEKIDNFIQKMQSKIESTGDIIVEWIPYNQFNNVKKTNKDGFATAIWKDGLLKYNIKEGKHERRTNTEVTLKFLNNSQYVISDLLNEAKAYSIKVDEYNIPKIYGISQNPDTNDYIIVLDNSFCKECSEIYIIYKWCKPCQINNLELNLANWTSGNKKIDEFIQEMQLKIEGSYNIIVEWIPYNQFNNVKKTNKDGVATAIWKNGLLKYDEKEIKYEREPNKEVILKCLNNSQNVISDLLIKAKAYSIKLNYEYDIPKIYGISQNPDTKDYIIVLNNSYCKECGEIYTVIWGKWCKPCQINNLKQNFTNRTSRNEKIDEFIQEMQFKIESTSDIIVEWIPYDQFNNVVKIGKDGIATAIWKNGLLKYDEKEIKYEREPNKEVTLKCLNNSQNVISNLLNEAKAYSIKVDDIVYVDNIPKIYGISQNLNTNEYVIVFQDGYYCKNCGKKYTEIYYHKWCKPCQINGLKQNFVYWTSGNERIDNFVQNMQLKINNYNDIIVEWIPYDQFNNIKEIGKGGFSTVYLAIWKDGPLKYDMELKRTTPNKEVALKCLYNSQNITNEFLNEVNAYSINFNDGILKIYGISQNPDTNDYIIVFEYASGGNLNNENNNIIRSYRWNEKLDVLSQIVKGLKNIHENKLAHRDFHTGNILVSIGYNSYYGYSGNSSHDIYISDMGLCGEVSNIDKTKIYGVMPFVAPEVLRGKPYNQAADVYSFGMIMYYIATGRQPFANRAHDSGLALNICNGIRPEINEQEAPKFYIELMKNCWDPDPDKRPSAIEIEKLIPKLSCEDKEINKQIEKAEEYRKTNILSTGNSQSIHPQACYTSRLLNQFTKELPKT
ncbi:Mkk2p [Rhizophagus irregularis DAOM 197198w]|uniref:non-specific serine/threonine protein kinase n=1 Tax=Rhizophagus irregularis (strain DAOM 197198w) TaxID=1432141 RepID=A0A015JNH0_RHIIW|nr:Mkk2p [Rhizophagus irregularis DAOM 197198w]